MQSSRGELRELQALIDRGTTSAGPHLRRTFELPEKALSAEQLTRYWSGGRRGIALATVTARGEPRVAPVEALLRGPVFYVPTARDASRVRHVRARAHVSFTHWVSDRVAVIVHGRARVVSTAEAEFADVDVTYEAGWWSPLRAAGSGVYIRIDPDRIFTWAADPSALPA